MIGRNDLYGVLMMMKRQKGRNSSGWQYVSDESYCIERSAPSKYASSAL
jgi:hypothetical protein